MLSVSQLRIWFFSQLEPDSPLYNVPRVTRWFGPLDLAILQRSVTEIGRRHAVLRSRYVMGEEVEQVVDPAGAVPLPLDDVTEAELQTRLRALVRRPFDLERGPVLRWALLRLAPNDHVVALVIHHIASDGLSVRIAQRELIALYAAFAAGKPSPLPEPSLQYLDFVAWQRQRLDSESLERERVYWRERLAGAPEVLDLPLDRPRPDPPTYDGVKHPVAFSPELEERLRQFSRRERVTLFMTMLAAFQTLLWRVTGETDVIVGVPVAGRPRRDFEDLIGCFTNTLILRSDLSGDPTFLELLKQVRGRVVSGFGQQELPFEMLVEELRPQRTRGHHPLFQVLFNFQDFPVPTESIPPLQVEVVDVDPGTAFVDLTLEVTRTAGGLACKIVYNVSLFQERTIERMAIRYRQLLEAILDAPGSRLSALMPPPTEGERGPSAQVGDTERLLADLEHLSDEEVARLLESELGGSSEELV